MDELTEDDIRRLFTLEFNKVLGTTPWQLERAGLIRRLARKLHAHFDAVGPPETQEEVLTYVRQAIDRYA